MPNRPPKEFMDAAVRSIKASGSAESPAAVAAAQWKKMSKKARAPWTVLQTLRETGAEIVPGNPGPALLPLAAAKPIAETVAQVVTGDIVVIRSILPRGTKKNPLPPLLVETHINLAAIGIGAFFLALAGLVGIVAWRGFGTTFFGRIDGIQDLVEERKEMPQEPPRARTESLACFLCRTLPFPASVPACVACAAGL